MRPRFAFLLPVTAVTALVIASVALGMILLRPQPLRAASTAALPREITVIGRGTARAEPDTTIVQLGVQTRAPTARAALQDNTAKMQALWTRLGELGVPETALETGYFNVWANQEGPSPDAMTYVVENRVVVTLDRGHESGALLEQVVDAGANSIGGITLTVAQPEELELQARDQALANARTRAEAIARASSATLGTLLRVTENTGMPPSPAQGGMAGSEAAA